MVVSLKYAVVERERRFLVAKLPGAAQERRRIVDRYVTGTRLRLREVVTEDGAVTRKLGHKVRLGEGPRVIACTSLYLDDDEWDVLCALPAKTLTKVRHLVARGGVTVAIDELEDGTLLAEIDNQDGAPVPVPSWLDVLRDVTDDEKWTGAQLAQQLPGRDICQGPKLPEPKRTDLAPLCVKRGRSRLLTVLRLSPPSSKVRLTAAAGRRRRGAVGTA